MKSVIWDWNGTLLNDLDHCIASINVLLEKRQLPLLSHNHYKEVFSFPVKDYYAAIGFDFSKEDFAIPAREFIDLYNDKVEHCSLHPAANAVLAHLQNKGNKQFVLSAMQEDMLEKTLKQQGIFDYFDAIAGLNHHYATSKIERGEQLIEQNKISKDNAVMIGDTIHDYEVAEQLGIKCILIADGHQSARRLKSTGAPVLDNLGELLKNGWV
ncbi:HAD family hydrolase [Maribellus sediminis]|uniref:HAD family hydrolase n=1 Tax=Maribellus sediminis TaxID=2696285 RepID=UPI001430BBC7|nr:HAD family hydrolase [Maribellus sediminis]